MTEATKAELRRLRTLLRERKARDEYGCFVAEGPRVVGAALDHGAPVERIYVEAESYLTERARRSGVPVVTLAAGAAQRIGDTVTPQPVFALVRLERHGLDALTGADLSVVGATVSDPGNAGTLMRSAAAAGAQVVGLGPGSVDAYNPKVVRASAGACFAIRTVEGVPTVQMLEALGAQGVQRLGATATGGTSPDALDLTAPTVFVLGHEAHGLDAGLPLDATVTIPMHAGESLNVAMAGSVLLFEAARQRRTR